MFKRTAASCNGAVVDDRDPGRADALADAARERAGALAIEVAFEAVTDRFVQQDARPAVAEHHRHLARRRIACRQIQERLVDRTHRIFSRNLIREVAVIGATAAARRSLLATAVLFHDDVHRHAHERTHVGGHEAVAARDHDGFVFGRERRHYLHDARIARSGDLLDAFEERHLRRIFQGRQRITPVVQRVRHGRVAQWRDGGLALAPDGPRCARGFFERLQRDVVGVGEGLLLALHGTHAHAAIDIERARLDDAFLEVPALDARILEIQVGEIDVVAVDGGQHAVEPGGIQARGSKQEAGGFGQQRAIGRRRSEVVHGVPLRRESTGEAP